MAVICQATSRLKSSVRVGTKIVSANTITCGVTANTSLNVAAFSRAFRDSPRSALRTPSSNRMGPVQFGSVGLFTPNSTYR